MTPETTKLLDDMIDTIADDDCHFTVNPITFHAWSLPHEYKGIKIFQDDWATINNIYLTPNEPSC